MSVATIIIAIAMMIFSAFSAGRSWEKNDLVFPTFPAVAFLLAALIILSQVGPSVPGR